MGDDDDMCSSDDEYLEQDEGDFNDDDDDDEDVDLSDESMDDEPDDYEAPLSVSIVAAYFLSNRVTHFVPVSNGRKAGRVRDMNMPIYVKDAATLNDMKSPKNWPNVDDIHPMSIVVTKGRLSEEEKLDKDIKKGPFTWSCRVGVKGKDDTDDTKILRHIPKAVCMELIKRLAREPELRESSLLTVYLPFKDNARTLPNQPNGFQKVKGLKYTTAKDTGKHPRMDTIDEYERFDDVSSKEDMHRTKKSKGHSKEGMLDKKKKKQEKAASSSSSTTTQWNMPTTKKHKAETTSAVDACTSKMEGDVEHPFKRVRVGYVQDAARTTVLWHENKYYIVEM